MIQVDCSKAASFVKQAITEKGREKAADAFAKVRKKTGAGAEWLGWRRILAEPNDAELEKINALAEKLRDEIDVFIVCGIGGSYLGAEALIQALKPAFHLGGEPEIIFAGNNINGSYLRDLIAYLEQPNAEGEPQKVAINAISKSGTTLETALAFRVLRDWLHEHFPEEASDRIICTTSAEGGALNALADKHGYDRFVIPEDVGGRFSVLTPVGLLPAAVAGIDIRALFYEAVAKYEELETNPDPLLEYAAVRYALAQEGKTIDLITGFETELTGLSRWLQQLFGESEGKEGKGIFPVVGSYSTDLHSIGQFVQQGTRSMMETFISVKKGRNSIEVEEMPGNEDGLNYLQGKSFHTINRKALEATRQAHYEGGVPCITIEMNEKNAQHLGEFIYFFELFTAVYCYMIGLNPFNQPGVEGYKKGMYKLLGKQ